MTSRDLSSSERNVIRDYIRFGSFVAVAQARGRSIKTIEKQTQQARQKLGGISLVQIAVLVDRESQVQFEAPAGAMQ